MAPAESVGGGPKTGLSGGLLRAAMTAEEFAAASAFEATDTGFAVTTTTFDATVAPGSSSVTVTVEVPTLGAAVVDETVPEVVEDGWFDTFRRRVADVEGLTPATVAEPAVTRHAERVAVETTVSVRTGAAADDALAVVNFIEGTWFGGIVPGYEYIEAVQAVRSEAARQGGSDEPTPL